MSRCFPFPPPGYEKKVGHDDVNLLEKDKKEKKRKDKKDKKEKDKRKKKEKKDREGKQNKDKEKSEDKHRKKKDQNEKHKDKNDKRAKKEKNRTSDEKYIAGPVGCSNGETPGSNCSQSEGTSEFKFLVEFGKRIKDEDKATENPMVQKINLTGKRSADFPGEVLKDKRDDDRKVFGQSNKVDARGNENGSVPNFIGGNERKVEGVAGLVDKYVEKRMEQKENDKHKNNDSKGDRNKDRDREKKSKSKDKKWEKKKPKEEEAPIKEQPNARESNLNAVFYSNNKPSSLLKKTNKNSHLGKRKELEMNGNLLDDSDIRPSKLQRPLHAHEVVENGRKLETRTTSTHSYMTSTQSLSELVGTVNNHKVNRTASFSRPVAENGPKLGVTPGKIQFGKHSKVNNNVPSSHPVLENGRILAMFTSGTQFAASECTSNDHKVDNKVSLFHPVLENGKVELYQAATGLATEGHAPVGNQKVNGKEIKINGLIEDKKPVVCSTRPSVSPVKVEKNVGKSLRPPHPDSKYLSQIFSIPSIKCSDFDDQEWLLGSYDFQTNKVRSGSSQVETKQVWAEALRIESADVTALPFIMELHLSRAIPSTYEAGKRYNIWTANVSVPKIGTSLQDFGWK